MGKQINKKVGLLVENFVQAWQDVVGLISFGSECINNTKIKGVDMNIMKKWNSKTIEAVKESVKENLEIGAVWAISEAKKDKKVWGLVKKAKLDGVLDMVSVLVQTKQPQKTKTEKTEKIIKTAGKIKAAPEKKSSNSIKVNVAVDSKPVKATKNASAETIKTESKKTKTGVSIDSSSEKTTLKA
jgi:hypothetical protein